MTKNKYGILTLHIALNYGAVLQTYALQTSLQRLGKEANVIDYQPKFLVDRHKINLRNSLFSVRGLYNTLFRNGFLRFNHEPFESFREQYLHLSKTIVSENDLESLLQEYDTIVCGSDQIWNPTVVENNPAYYLPYKLKNTRKTAYAASFGVEQLPDDWKDNVTKWISDFDHVSVREKTGQDIIRQLLQIEVPVVLDPSLLLDSDDWREIASSNVVPQRPYVLLYMLSQDKQLIQHAKIIANAHNYEVVYINDRLFPVLGVKNLAGITPQEWLGLFLNAQYIVTNSFHGVAFAINFEKQFAVRFIPKSPTSSRISGLLSTVGLSDRVLIDEFINSDIDYQAVLMKLDQHREFSKQYLEQL